MLSVAAVCDRRCFQRNVQILAVYQLLSQLLAAVAVGAGFGVEQGTGVQVGGSFLCASGDLHPTLADKPEPADGGLIVVLPATILTTHVSLSHFNSIWLVFLQVTVPDN